MSADALSAAHRIPAWMLQFRDLQGRDPGLWPLLPRMTCALLVLLAVVAAGAWFIWSSQSEQLDNGRASEQRLRAAFEQKVAQVHHLDDLKRRKADAQAMVALLESQLPGKAEMDALLSDISQAGSVRGLQFELFKPGQERIGEFYAELPIEIRLVGSFHALAGFVSDVTHLRRIVSIDRVAMARQQGGQLSFECVAHAYRYLEPAEAAARRQQAADARKRVQR